MNFEDIFEDIKDRYIAALDYVWRQAIVKAFVQDRDIAVVRSPIITCAGTEIYGLGKLWFVTDEQQRIYL